jgi:hypothetical protein
MRYFRIPDGDRPRVRTFGWVGGANSVAWTVAGACTGNADVELEAIYVRRWVRVKRGRQEMKVVGWLVFSSPSILTRFYVFEFVYGRGGAEIESLHCDLSGTSATKGPVSSMHALCMRASRKADLLRGSHSVTQNEQVVISRNRRAFRMCNTDSLICM